MVSLLEASRSIHNISFFTSFVVTQYDGNPMTEVLRSKLYYARSALMIAIPTYNTIDVIPIKGQGIIRQAALYK